MTLQRGRFVSHAAEFLGRVNGATRFALEDVADIAKSNKGAPSDTRAEMTAADGGRVGSSRPYAKAQEKGAYITPKQRRALRFRSGLIRKRARLPARRWLSKAVTHYGERLATRLRAV